MEITKGVLGLVGVFGIAAGAAGAFVATQLDTPARDAQPVYEVTEPVVRPTSLCAPWLKLDP